MRARSVVVVDQSLDVPSLLIHHRVVVERAPRHVSQLNGICKTVLLLHDVHSVQRMTWKSKLFSRRHFRKSLSASLSSHRRSYQTQCAEIQVMKPSDAKALATLPIIPSIELRVQLQNPTIAQKPNATHQSRIVSYQQPPLIYKDPLQPLK